MAAGGALDGNAYRKKVLARLAADFSIADPESGDPFFVFDLDPDSDQATVLTRIGDIVALWQKERTSIKYKGVAADLVAARSRFEAVLADPVRRGEAAARVKAERTAASAERFGDLDRLAGQLAQRFGGIPAEKVDQLQMVARRAGTDDAAFADWLGRQQVLVAAGRPVQPWEPAIRRQIRTQLAELARQTGDPARYATLWTFLDLSPSCSDPQLVARHAELLAANHGARHDSAKTRTGELLAQVKTRLLPDGGRAAYAAGLRADAVDLIYPDVAEKALVVGEVTAADYETLVQRVIALGWGISNDEARAIVREAATALGASLAVAPAVDYLICGHCRAPQAAPEAAARAGARCRYCAEALYLSCPNCDRLVEVAAVTCPNCGISFAAHRQATAQLVQAQQELAAGHPLTAQELLAGAGTATVPGRAEVAAEITAALAAARSEWQALEQDLSAGRVWAGYDRAARLYRTAADVPGPSGVSVDARRAELVDLKAELQAEVRQAAALPPEQAERALAQLLVRAVDCPEAIAALAGIPLAGPTDLRVRTTEAGVLLEWQPAPAPGPVSYRVVRVRSATSGSGGSGGSGETGGSGERGDAGETATIGTTSATGLEDAGAPGGTELRYEVSAVAGRRSSAPLLSEPILMIRDVGGVRARATDAGVELTWSGQVGTGDVVIERSTDQAALRRRIRPEQSNRYLDPDVSPGTTYSYRVFVEYRRKGLAPKVTEGRTADIRVPARPVPVTGLWVENENDRTVVNFISPPAGMVQIYAGPAAVRPAEPGTFLDADQLAALAGQARLVGSARRRLIDPDAAGRIRYTPVTVVEDRAVVGTGLDHLAIGRVSNLTAVDRGDNLLLRFDLPPGATEALIHWRFGEPPAGPDDSAAQAAKVTNTKLEIAGGFEVPAPDDGRAVFVAVYPAMRPDGGPLVSGPFAATLQARAAR